jgi:hypothetical protein
MSFYTIEVEGFTDKSGTQLGHARPPRRPPTASAQPAAEQIDEARAPSFCGWRCVIRCRPYMDSRGHVREMGEGPKRSGRRARGAGGSTCA